MEKYYIYSLEYNDVIFYIGKTYSLKIRISKHIRDAKLKRTHKENFINKVLTSGGHITISIIDIVNKGEENYWEIYWISQIKSWGIKLYNGTSGGDGGDYWTGRKHTKETIDKLRNIRKKYLENNKGKMPICPGEKNGKSKLKSYEVIDIRRLREEGMSYGKLSIKFNISRSAIINIVKRRRWKHI